MKIESVYDAGFTSYGKVLTGYDVKELLQTLEAVTPLPEGTDYVASQPELEALPTAFCANCVLKNTTSTP